MPVKKVSVLSLLLASTILVITALPISAQTQENVISLAHHSNTECTASVNGMSTSGLIAESSGTPQAQGGVCHVNEGESVDITLTAPTDPTTIAVQGLKDNSIATYYDENHQVVGTYTAGSGYVNELPALMVSSIKITNQSDLLLENGSFESPTSIDDGNIAINLNNPTEIPGWEVVSGNIDWFGPGVAAADGARSVDISGSGVGSIRQTIETEVGKAYVLRFAVSGDPAGGLPEKQLTVSVGDVTETFTYLLTSENSVSNMLWQYHTIEFTATEPTTELTFTSLVDNWYGPTIDNVSVREGQLCSPASSGELPINFVNNTNEEVSFHWLSFDCEEGGGPVLAPGAQEQGITFPGHIFRIRGADGRIIGLYVASAENTTASVGEG
ncbi:MAG: hypothetical protein CL610_30115 [Anaerolineaceae bacterium]|nr:hypothetical protein [Anaerolineaceae bacterium]